jgi:hypothetical protein
MFILKKNIDYIVIVVGSVEKSNNLPKYTNPNNLDGSEDVENNVEMCGKARAVEDFIREVIVFNNIHN